MLLNELGRGLGFGKYPQVECFGSKSEIWYYTGDSLLGLISGPCSQIYLTLRKFWLSQVWEGCCQRWDGRDQGCCYFTGCRTAPQAKNCPRESMKGLCLSVYSSVRWSLTFDAKFKNRHHTVALESTSLCFRAYA